MVQHVHGYGIDHGCLSNVILEDKDHVEVLKVELDTLEVHELHLVHHYDEGGPLRQVDEAS